MESYPEQILHVGFNQDYGCFSVGTTNGFRVYNCEPFKETFCRGFNNGGIGIVEMLFRCNILAIVGGGAAPRYPPTKTMIWDDHQGKCIGEMSFRSQVRAVRLRRDRIVVALEHKVLVYNFADLKLLHQTETAANPRGLVAISSVAAASSSTDNTVLACPGLHTGQVRIELYDRRQTKFIAAHTNALCCLALSLCGKRLATASEKGTLVRVWNTADGQLLQELRRGADPAHVYSLALSRCCEWLALTSDKGTVHVFALSPAVAVAPTGGSGGGAAGGGGGAGGVEDGKRAGSPEGPASTSGEAGAAGGGAGGATPPQRQNPTSFLSIVKGYVPAIPLPKYFNSEWSFAQFRVHEEPPDPATGAPPPSIAGFGSEPHTVLVVTGGGSFYKVAFDPAKGGQCSQLSYCKFMERSDGVV
ncbi:hypothetical protein HXX76_000815 [Chlamydomonas incerta]|uniref:WD repeat domain phosphoinositide-interacting protein 3 n=1 Tax=Chlamydomonas incerta TaxID=51695 RepID=A0A835WF55_CHLIN|nr:hypothetical protein HXX76_000815 [Chlamydomonas incerta]|eukprot:KAG2446223.1 hypothetical protein HXX76_000815 [Chlamydomonas incerta]